MALDVDGALMDGFAFVTDVVVVVDVSFVVVVSVIEPKTKQIGPIKLTIRKFEFKEN